MPLKKEPLGAAGTLAFLLCLPAPAFAQPQAVVRDIASAHIRYQVTHRANGETGGGRPSDGMRELLMVCNNIRAGFYELPAQSPPDTVIDALDSATAERYFAVVGGRAMALTTEVYRHLVLPDLQRWQNELRTSPLPATPPDCAQHREADARRSSLWRDDVVYEIDHEKRRAAGRSLPNQFRPHSQPPAAELERFNELPAETIAGHTCRAVRLAGAMAESDSCLLQAAGAARWLNRPLPLRMRASFGSLRAPHREYRAESVVLDGAIAPSVFEIPSGYNVTIDGAPARAPR